MSNKTKRITAEQFAALKETASGIYFTQEPGRTTAFRVLMNDEGAEIGFEAVAKDGKSRYFRIISQH